MEQSIIESVQAAIEADEESQGYFQAYDDIDQLRWELPNGWEAKDYIRKRVSTIGHDGLKSLDSLFDTHNPKFDKSTNYFYFSLSPSYFARPHVE